jgi:hypothetical protein
VQPGGLTQHRPATVGRHHEIRPQLTVPVRPRVPHADDAAVLHDRADDLGLHPQVERRFGLAGRGQQVQQVPLRHHRDVLVPAGQVAEVAHHDAAAVRRGKLDAVDVAGRQAREPLAEA